MTVTSDKGRKADTPYIFLCKPKQAVEQHYSIALLTVHIQTSCQDLTQQCTRTAKVHTTMNKNCPDTSQQ